MYGSPEGLSLLNNKRQKEKQLLSFYVPGIFDWVPDIGYKILMQYFESLDDVTFLPREFAFASGIWLG